MKNFCLPPLSPASQQVTPRCLTYVQQPFQKSQPLKTSNPQKIQVVPQTARSKSPNRLYEQSSISRVRTSSPLYSSRSVSEEWKTMITKLSKDFSCLRGFLMDKDEESTLIRMLQKKVNENKQLELKVEGLESKVKAMEKEYQNNLEVLSEKVDDILNENSRLRSQLENCKRDKEEEVEYFQLKQKQFLEEHQEMLRLRKQLDNQVLDTSRENFQQIIDLKNEEIQNLLKHIENFRLYLQEN